MVDLDDLTNTINGIASGMKDAQTSEEAIDLLRKELFNYFNQLNSLLKEFILEVRNLNTEQANQWKAMMVEDNRKSAGMISEIKTYITNNNKLFGDISEHLKVIGEKVSKPVLIPPPMEIPNEMLNKMDKMIELQEMTHGELEGLYFYTTAIKVNVAGKPVRVADKRKTKSMVIIAESGNSGNIYVGDRGVSASHAGAVLKPGESIPMDVDLNKREVFINSSSDGDGVNCVIMAYRPETAEGGSR